MFFYDSTIVKLLGITIPTKKLIKQSLVINSFSNLIGFAGLIGVVLRTYFFQSYEMDKHRLLKTIANVSFFYLTGISLLSLVIVADFRDIPLLLETKWLYLAVIGVGLYLPILVIITFIKNKKSSDTSIHFRTRFQLIFISFMEWISIFLAIWLLAVMLKIPFHFNDIFPIFIVASCAGIVSMIPGGLGSFDLVFIWGSQYLGIQDEKIIASFYIEFAIYPFSYLDSYFSQKNFGKNGINHGIISRIFSYKMLAMCF